MITYTIYYNKVKRGSCNLISKDIKGHYITVNRVLNRICIDNVQVCEYNEVNQIKFMVKGYYQIIDCNCTGSIETIK